MNIRIKTLTALALIACLAECTCNPKADAQDIPAFINLDANHIISNGADFTNLQNAFAASQDSTVSIVLIGDSHVQPDIAGRITRELLQNDFGNAGRGIIAPLKITGTNQPEDFTFSSPDKWDAVKIMKKDWFQTMGFNGTSIHPVNKQSSLNFATKSHPFNELTLFHEGNITILDIKDAEGKPMEYETIPTDSSTIIKFKGEPVKSVTLDFDSEGDLVIFGAYLSNGQPGLVYNTIGNNGAQYLTYNKIGTVGKGISQLKPNLVIISLGTNEAFDTKVNVERFTRSIDKMVSDIKEYNPNAMILLTTPKECHQGRKAKGGKVYHVNTNIPTVRETILAYGKEHNLPVHDWYEVAGGKGASTQWISRNLLSKDRVHNTVEGYNLYGQLLYNALSEILKK